MFSHVMVGSNDIDRSRKFYDALFGAVGGKPGVQDPKGRLLYPHNGGLLMVSKPIDGKSASHANGGTIGFAIANPEQADAWHKAGVANGGTAALIRERTSAREREPVIKGLVHGRGEEGATVLYICSWQSG